MISTGTTAMGAKSRECTTVNMHAQKVKHDGIEDLFITGTATKPDDIRRLFDSIAELLKRFDACIVHQDIFGGADAHDTVAQSLGQILWPLTFFPRSGMDSGLGAGTYIHATIGANVRRITRDDRVVGSIYETSAMQYCRLGGLLPSTRASQTEQAKQVFELIETTIGDAGMNFENVVRTWFCLDNILEWYKGFSNARSEFFKLRGITEDMFPASTAVGGRNSQGAAILAGALALKPKHDSLTVQRISSPTQGPATAYGSSFSRAIELRWPGHRQLLVSGTASISQTGKTFHSSNPSAQVRHTMEILDACLKSRQMSWRNVVRTTAFVRSVADLLSLSRYLIDNNVPPIPTVIAQNTLCRDDLFFQVEVDALAADI